MITLGSLLLIQAVSLATAGIIVPTSKVIEGPSSKTTLVGPDGSVITSIAQGAKIVTDGHSAIIAAPDTEAILKESEHPKIVESHVQPLVETREVPIAASKIARSVYSYPISYPELNHVEAIPLIKHHFEPVAISHAFPVHTIEAHVAPVAQASPVHTIEAHVAPLVKSTDLHLEPVVVDNLKTKTSISEHSQTIVHPAPSVKHESVFVPVLNTKTAIVKDHGDSIIATKIDSGYTNVEAVAQPVHVVKSIELLHSVPVIAEHVPVPVIGTKTTISGHSQSIVHPSPAVHLDVVAKAIPVVAEVAPVVTANVIKSHSIPLAAHAHVPVIGTQTTISENSHTLVSHSW